LGDQSGESVSHPGIVTDFSWVHKRSDEKGGPICTTN
jgi:hypothetical protein